MHTILLVVELSVEHTSNTVLCHISITNFSQKCYHQKQIRDEQPRRARIRHTFEKQSICRNIFFHDRYVCQLKKKNGFHSFSTLLYSLAIPIGSKCIVYALFRLQYNFSIHVQKVTRMVEEQKRARITLSNTSIIFRGYTKN